MKFKKLLEKYKISPAQAFYHLPFLGFLTLLGVLNIANGYMSIENIEEIQTLQKEIKELRWQAIDIESKMLSEAKESQISNRVSSLNLEVSKTVPKTIVIP